MLRPNTAFIALALAFLPISASPVSFTNIAEDPAETGHFGLLDLGATSDADASDLDRNGV